MIWNRDWPWQKASEHWLDLPWWTPGDSAQSIWIYFDGSSAQQKELAGCGVACFILDKTWKFAGALSVKLPVDTTSYTAEATGAAIATKFLYDILKVASLPTPPEVWLCYDSTTVGEQAVGNWEARRSPTLFAFMRSMVLLIEHRFHVQIQHHHILWPLWWAGQWDCWCTCRSSWTRTSFDWGRPCVDSA